MSQAVSEGKPRVSIFTTATVEMVRSFAQVGTSAKVVLSSFPGNLSANLFL